MMKFIQDQKGSIVNLERFDTIQAINYDNDWMICGIKSEMNVNSRDVTRHTDSRNGIHVIWVFTDHEDRDHIEDAEIRAQQMIDELFAGTWNREAQIKSDKI